ncbi:ethanolamine utilization protein EutN [candidate division LCP-89 bacterium B3_LCP]|uniref:Ethanolamine utilization protein EutN n=1 Tax=candidate division LCP-89 bacterium B3_LCP TaxID=2012998 RepID=A0A532UY06_UNCL8|nr:MAG: ethanolamine utilization protein EutN [candidate division LCP-89 bacterium B3_LCP]
MNIAKVIGTIWATVKDDHLQGSKLQIIQPLNEKGEKMGQPLTAVDTVGAGQNEVVFYVTSREAALGFPEPLLTPVDAAIVGIIDRVEVYSNSE